MKKTMVVLGKWLDAFNNALELVAGLGAFLFMAILCFQVMMRYVFSNPIFGIDEAVVALMVWICSLGWCTVYWQNGHAILEFIVKRLGAMPRRIIFHCTNLMILVISIIFVPASVKLFQMQIVLKPVGGLPLRTMRT